MQVQIASIKPNLMVQARRVEGPECQVWASGTLVGTVEKMEAGLYVRLKPSGEVDGRTHWFPVAWIEDVDDKAVYLSKTPEEFSRDQLDENPLEGNPSGRPPGKSPGKSFE